MRRALLLLPLLVACHSGTTRMVDVTVSDEVVGAYSEASPGLLVAELGGTVAWYVALCGQAADAPFLLSKDVPYSCLGEKGSRSAGDEETVRVWIEPLPEGWDAAAICATREASEFHRPQAAAEGEDVAALADEPEPGWPQAEGTASWKRDITPCGGYLRLGLTLE
ncbi:MAG TPA: hypothetical protein VK013_18995 [Myxococcaceae bacterium]|nr:hypothetical protein [Myxococcaceae bacterium]